MTSKRKAQAAALTMLASLLLFSGGIGLLRNRGPGESELPAKHHARTVPGSEGPLHDSIGKLAFTDHEEDVAMADIREILNHLCETAGEPGPERESVSRLVRRWTAFDAAAAAKWAEEMKPGPLRDEAIDQVALVWGAVDLRAATEWAKATVNRDGGQALRQLAYEAARTEPLAALELAVDLPADQRRDDLIHHTCLQWAGQDPSAAAAWAGQIEDDTLRERALAAIATAWAERDPYEAGRLAVEAIPPGRQRDDAVTAIVQRWVQQEPERAAEWVNSFGESPLKVTSMENLISIWRNRDPASLEAWLARR